MPCVAMAVDPVSVFTLGEIEVSAKADEDRANSTVDRVYADEQLNFDRNTIADAANLLPGVTLSVTGYGSANTYEYLYCISSPHKG